VAAVADHALEAAAGVDDQVLEKHLAHERAQGAIELAHLAARRVDRDAEEVEPLACGMPIALVARNAIDVLGDDDIEAERFDCSHQVLEARTIDGRGAGDLAIAEGQYERKAFAGAELAAGRDLIVDGSIVLTIGREAGVNCCADHLPLPPARPGGRARPHDPALPTAMQGRAQRPKRPRQAFPRITCAASWSSGAGLLLDHFDIARCHEAFVGERCGVADDVADGGFAVGAADREDTTFLQLAIKDGGHDSEHRHLIVSMFAATSMRCASISASPASSAMSP
jgi:hypothetical protein